MRVLFLTLYPDLAASPRYRVTQFLPYLRAHGVECTVASPVSTDEWRRLTGPQRQGRALWYHVHETRRRLVQILSARPYDIVFLQKAIMTAYVRGMAGLMRARARRLVYDIDDAVHLAPPHPLPSHGRWIEDREQVQKIIRTADLVLAGNAWLASEARAAGGHVETSPTVVDTEQFVPPPSPPDIYRIGWIGNPSTAAYLEPLADVFRAIPDAEVCLVGADPAQWPGPRVEFRPWQLDTEMLDLARFSVGIMPQPDTPWALGKCGLKALLYMACGIPVVASPVGVAREIIEHNVNGFLASTAHEWREAFERLRDPALRARFGAAGRATVVARYSLEGAAPRLLHLLETLP
ncbi:MAG TPA: glycosyltransferase family 4 protein [Candidatus Hydrogenedentes bacterium]|nr:glycosyltransferase family 4 protein [Candidatus Hydrogenedentota bacterium]